MNLVVTVFDKASEKFAPPTIAPTLKVAQRMFKMQLSKMEDDILSDFQFFIIGEFDENTGKITSQDKVEFFLGSD